MISPGPQAVVSDQEIPAVSLSNSSGTVAVNDSPTLIGFVGKLVTGSHALVLHSGST